MNVETVISREPLLRFARSRQFISHSEINDNIGSPSLWLDGSSTHLLNRLIVQFLPRISEAVWLESLLTAPEWTNFGTISKSVSSFYMPPPGLKEGITISPDPLEVSDSDPIPSIYRRIKAWLVAFPNPCLILLSYDPSSLPVLSDPSTHDFFRKLAFNHRPDLVDQLASPSAIQFGITSIHQFFEQSDRWRRFTPSPELQSIADVVSNYAFEPFLITDLAIYAWEGGTGVPTAVDRNRMENLTCRRLYTRPRLYQSELGERHEPPAPPSYALLNSEQNRWREAFLKLLEEAVERQDSDFHIYVKSNGGLNFFRRRDGDLEFVDGIPSSSVSDFYSAILSNSGVDLQSRPETPKDARASILLPNLRKRVDLRISIQPDRPPHTVPAAVIRILDASLLRGGIDPILVTDFDRKMWNYALSLSGKLILVTGPTGSGKSRTVYSALQTLHERHPEMSFKSVEDPIEYNIGDWLQQNQINADLNVSFWKMLRNLLRADLDVLFVGEIRDKETASMAIEAALSGHLVIATTHVVNTTKIAERFAIEWGLENITSVLGFATAQRLMGRSCRACRTFVPLSELKDQIPAHRMPKHDGLYCVNPGCPECSNRGARGRFSIQEYLTCDSELESDRTLIEAIKNHDSISTRAELALRNLPSLEERAWEMARGENALTNISQVLNMR